MRFKNFLVEAENEKKPSPDDTRQDKLKLKIQKLQKELAEQNERMGYLNSKKEDADEKGIHQIEQEVARMAQKADRIKEEIARLKGKL